MPSSSRITPAGEGRVNPSTVTKAVSSLLQWTRARHSRPQLVSDPRDDALILVVTFRYAPSNPRPNKSHLLPLPHPPLLFDAASVSVCAIVDDRPNSASPSPSAVLEAAKKEGLPVEDTIGLSTLRTDYVQYEAKRFLARAHHMFVADRRIVPLLPKLIGKAFFQSKRVPLAVDFGRSGWPQQLKRILASTQFSIGNGTCSGIKIGRIGMEEEKIVENVLAAIEEAVELVPKKWKNVRSLHLKTVHSLALPIYQKLPDETGGLKIPLLPLTADGDQEVVGRKRKKMEKEEDKKEKTEKRKKRKPQTRSIISKGVSASNDVEDDAP